MPKFPLHNAAATGLRDLARRHLKNGVLINSKDDYGRTPLHCAIREINHTDKCYRMCKYLLDNGADVNANDNNNKMPLHYLDYHCKPDGEWSTTRDGKVLQLLIKHGANINTNGSTLLHTTIESKNLEATEHFLRLGADPNAKVDGWSMLALATATGSEEMLKLLLNHNVNVNDTDALRVAVHGNLPKSLKILFESGADLSRVDFNAKNDIHPVLLDYNYLLKRTIYYQNSEILTCMIENGVDVSTRQYCLLKFASESSFHEASSAGPALEEIIKQIAYLTEIDRTLIRNESTMQIIEENSHLKEKYEECLEEIKVMKDTRVSEKSCYTYFDLLHKRGEQLMKCCDEKVSSAMKTQKLAELFPYFAERLKRNVQRGLLERDIKENFEALLYKTLKYKLSFDLIRYISDYLEIRDMKACYEKVPDSEV